MGTGIYQIKSIAEFRSKRDNSKLVKNSLAIYLTQHAKSFAFYAVIRYVSQTNMRYYG